MRQFFIYIAITIASLSFAIGQEQIRVLPKLHVDSTGQVYSKADAPAYIFIAPTEMPEQLMLVPSTDKGANPMYWDGPGSHYLVHRDTKRNLNVKFRVLADGYAPKTSIKFNSGLIFQYKNVFFVTIGATATPQTTDDMSGIGESYISIDKMEYKLIREPINFPNEKEYDVTVYSVDNVGNIETPKEFRVITATSSAVKMEDITFDTNSAKIKPETYIELNKLVTILKQYPDVHLEIRAHTDSWGSARYNLSLSEKRAEAAVAYLTSKGVPKKQLSAKGFGDTMLLNECARGVKCSPEKHKENRRVEFVISKLIED
jgi:outer membrane protein OmpA-like peptidoglycan-associated protein